MRPRRRRPWRFAERRLRWRWHIVVTVGWALVLALSASLSSSGWGQDLARGLHLLGAVIAFGAVLLVDWYGLVWISGLRTFRETLRVSEAAFPLVWLGLILLLVSGVFLAPDLGAPLTWVKQIAVLLLLNNGIFARRLGARLALLPPRLHSLSELPVPLRHMVMTSLALSQVGWWTAMFIGYLATAASR